MPAHLILVVLIGSALPVLSIFIVKLTADFWDESLSKPKDEK